ncbi:MAG: nucleotide exchange factor GrpE [Chloroflexi bacterium]|nr:nucleotide exchange factor GrpE [Chloroflexota bacterium]
MSSRRQVWATLASLLHRLETAVSDHVNTLPPDLEGVEKEVRKLGKVQFKANMLAESQVTQWEQLVTAVQSSQSQNEQLLAQIREGGETAVSQKLLIAMLPALDSLEEAIGSGQQYLVKRDKAALAPSMTPDQAKQLVSPADRAMLSGWLDGLRLIREHLLTVLEAGGVTPILTTGHPFDPFKHRAVGILPAGNNTPNNIAREERTGYQIGNGVLRYAEVIVYKQQEQLT